MPEARKRCPKCGAKQFIVSPHVIQDWLVDEYGEFLEVLEACSMVAHHQDDDDIWTCAQCYYSGTGYEFNVSEEEIDE